MSPLTIAITAMLSALTFYTIGVWGERLSQALKPIHVLFFFAGLISDSIGTDMMFKIAHNAFTLGLHSITGAVALVLMILHALWAAVTVIRSNKAALQTFHRFSTAVWMFWLIPFFAGVAANSVH